MAEESEMMTAILALHDLIRDYATGLGMHSISHIQLLAPDIQSTNKIASISAHYASRQIPVRC